MELSHSNSFNSQNSSNSSIELIDNKEFNNFTQIHDANLQIKNEFEGTGVKL